MSFAKWDLPAGKGGDMGRENVIWHEDCRTEWLDGYHALAEEMQERVMGERECYREPSCSSAWLVTNV